MTQFAWHIHHEVLVEPLTEPIENRIAFIRTNKPDDEIETRLRLLKPVQGVLPVAVVEAWKAYDEAWKAYDEAWTARDEAWKAYDEAWKAYDEAWKARDEAWKARVEAEKAYVEVWNAYVEAGKACDEAWKAYVEEIEALHAIECPNCPWDGHTIFPKEKP